MVTAYRVEIDCFVLSCSGADWLSDCSPCVWDAWLTANDGNEAMARNELRDDFGYFFKRIGDGSVKQAAWDAFGVESLRLLVR